MLRLFVKLVALIAAIELALLCLIVAFGLWYFSNVSRTTVSAQETVLEIPYGSSLRRVSSILENHRIITNASRFYWYVRLGRSDAHRFQAGFYQFNGAITYKEIADRLLTGRERAFRVVFKEGESLAELAHTLIGFGLCSQEEFDHALGSDEVRAGALPNLLPSGIEGYLFPDTYFFSKRETAKSIILKMHRRFLDKVSLELQSRMAELNVTLHYALTVASIVEKETGAAFERPMVASVYLNRLQRGMKLQADPTVIYGLNNFSGKITKKDLRTPHPYNTYVHKGLPPGPISSVGLASLRAVLWPDQTNYLYFVSKNDGTHHFCENLKCHNVAVKKWQIDFFKSKISRKITSESVRKLVQSGHAK